MMEESDVAEDSHQGSDEDQEKDPGKNNNKNEDQANLPVTMNQENKRDFFKFEIAKFVVENDLPFSLTDRLVQLVHNLTQKFSSDSLPNLTANKNDTSKFATAISKHLQDQSLKKLSTCNYSIAIDGGKANGNKEYLAINARFYETPDSLVTTTKFLGLVPFRESAEGEAIHDMVDNFLFTGPKGEARKQKLIGISSDHASNMISAKDKGATNRFENELGIVVTHDLCHAFNLIIQACLDSFPTQYTQIVTNIAKKFSKSPIKTAQLRTHLAENQQKELEVLSYTDTRWTSYIQCLERFIELYASLDSFFEVEARKKKKENKMKNYFTQENILMLRLLLTLLGKLKFYLVEFEKDNLETSEVVKYLKQSKVVLSEYLFHFEENSESYMEYLRFVNSSEEDMGYQHALRGEEDFRKYFLQQNSHFVTHLNNIDQEHQLEITKRFFEHAKNFLKTAFKQLNKRLPAADSILMTADSLFLRTSADVDRLRSLGTKFPNVIKPHEVSDFNHDIERLGQERHELFPVLSQNRKNPLVGWKQESESFKLVYKLIRALGVLPYSTANIERTFSAMGNIQTDKRNRLGIKTLEACLLIKQEYAHKDLILLQGMLTNYNKPLLESNPNSLIVNIEQNREMEALSNPKVVTVNQRERLQEEQKEHQSSQALSAQNRPPNAETNEELMHYKWLFDKFGGNELLAQILKSQKNEIQGESMEYESNAQGENDEEGKTPKKFRKGKRPGGRSPLGNSGTKQSKLTTMSEENVDDPQTPTGMEEEEGLETEENRRGEGEENDSQD